MTNYLKWKLAAEEKLKKLEQERLKKLENDYQRRVQEQKKLRKAVSKMTAKERQAYENACENEIKHWAEA